jgi:hypothetical protein
VLSIILRRTLTMLRFVKNEDTFDKDMIAEVCNLASNECILYDVFNNIEQLEVNVLKHNGKYYVVKDDQNVCVYHTMAAAKKACR